MKKVVSIAFIAALAFIASPVFAGVSDTTHVVVVNNETETPIKPEELPQPVKDALKGDDFAGWTVSSAVLVKDGDVETYKVEVTKAEEKKWLVFTKEGQLVK